MSTCPDADLYSAYIDGEVPSPWKEKLEAHIMHCPKCTERIKRYQNLQDLIKQDIKVTNPAFLEASWDRLQEKTKDINFTTKYKQKRIIFSTLLEARVPLPVVAAAVIFALFVPLSFITQIKLQNNVQKNQPLTLAIQKQDQQLALNTMAVYSPDLPASSLSTKVIDINKDNLFQLVQAAKQFATDKNLFSNGEIIIIRLPDLTRFFDTSDSFLIQQEPLLQTVLYNK